MTTTSRRTARKLLLLFLLALWLHDVSAAQEAGHGEIRLDAGMAAQRFGKTTENGISASAGVGVVLGERVTLLLLGQYAGFTLAPRQQTYLTRDLQGDTIRRASATLVRGGGGVGTIGAGFKVKILKNPNASPSPYILGTTGWYDSWRSSMVIESPFPDLFLEDVSDVPIFFGIGTGIDIALRPGNSLFIELNYLRGLTEYPGLDFLSARAGTRIGF